LKRPEQHSHPLVSARSAIEWAFGGAAVVGHPGYAPLDGSSHRRRPR
jgi:hypothetical protein